MKKFSIAVFLFIIASLLFTSVLSAGFALRFYASYNRLRTDPLGLQGRDGLQGSQVPLALSYEYLFIGDSLIENLSIEGADVLNLGIGGQTSGQVRYRMQLLSPDLRARTALVCAGGNDLKRLRFEPGQKDIVLDAAQEHLGMIIDEAKKRSEVVCLMTIPPMYRIPLHLKYLPSTRLLVRSLDELNRRIGVLASEKGVELIDSGAVLESLPAKERLAADGIHLSARANEAILSRLRQALR